MRDLEIIGKSDLQEQFSSINALKVPIKHMELVASDVSKCVDGG